MVNAKKRCVLDVIFKLILEGKTKKDIQENLDIKKNNLCNHLRRLEDLGAIKREGKFIIKVLNPSFASTQIHPRVTINQVHKKLNKRGHAFNFKVFFSNETNLLENEKVINEFKKGNLEKLPFGSYKFFRANSTIWINKDSITIYSNNSYYSKNTLHSKFRVIQDIDNLAKQLKDRFGFKGIYGIECFREHYGLIFNKFAKWIINKGGKMYVKDNRGKAILWVDKSRKDDIGLMEFEGKNPIIINNADTFFKSHEKNGFKVDADFTLSAINKLTNAQIENNRQLLGYAEQNKEHLALIQDYRKESASNRKIMQAILEKINKNI